MLVFQLREDAAEAEPAGQGRQFEQGRGEDVHEASLDSRDAAWPRKRGLMGVSAANGGYICLRWEGGVGRDLESVSKYAEFSSVHVQFTKGVVR